MRLWWDKTPVAIFLNGSPYHGEDARHVVVESIACHDQPILFCRDLEEMQTAGTFDHTYVKGKLIMYLLDQALRASSTYQYW